ncbi:NTP transferase domain-containing protein [Sphingomonas sp. AP4-R1]|uniref:NTP transferase domain-containing protein n=1 Tax=Sphingomonas sp. AP4-R1 TaxID=2735134 RepID=UPI0014936E63|nr:NTP transferase domain-containing protein [Sphingomonas sp. AP4-R1]QJU59716.1 NTP transferase domain-containing protein [Sphingomonas sp. AP4-R1]
MRIAGVLLAAGRSTRFGADDKLAAMLGGRPLLHHAADAMRAAPLASRFLVRSGAVDGLDGFATVAIPQGAEMSRSLAAGIAAARAAGADAALVALGDMPFVPAAHLATLIAACEGPGALLASGDATRRAPPALFGSDWFADLEAATGDAGARSLLTRATLLPLPPEALRDIDTVDDLRVAERDKGNPKPR